MEGVCGPGHEHLREGVVAVRTVVRRHVVEHLTKDPVEWVIGARERHVFEVRTAGLEVADCVWARPAPGMPVEAHRRALTVGDRFALSQETTFVPVPWPVVPLAFPRAVSS